MGEGRGAPFYQQFFDDTGTPISGVKVYHYAAGTTTDKTIWRNSGKTDPAGQPHIGDSGGRVILYGDGEYRFLITTSDDIVVADIDNYRLTADQAFVWEGSNGTTLPAVETNNTWHAFVKHDGSGNIVGIFVNNGTEYIDITGKVNDNEYNVKTYGAVGDGSTDDTSALQQALAQALITNGTVYLPEGHYRYSALPFNITDTVTIRGQGRRQTILEPLSGYNGWCIEINDCWRNGGEGQSTVSVDTSVGKNGVILRDFTIIGDRSLAETQNGIRTVERVDDLKIESVDIIDMKGGGLWLGVSGSLGLCRESVFIDVGVRRCGDSSNPPFRVSTGTSAGDGTNQLDFLACKIVTNFSAAVIDCQCLGSHDTRRIRFSNAMIHGRNNLADAPADDVLRVTGRVRDFVMTNSTVNGSHNVSSTKYAGIRFEADANGEVPIRAQLVGYNQRNCQGHGVVIDEVNRLLVVGCSDPGTIGGDDLQVNTGAITGHVTWLVESNTPQTITLASGQESLISTVYGDGLPLRAERIEMTNSTNNPPSIYAYTNSDLTNGSPEGVVTAEIGSILMAFNATGLVRAGNQLWVKAANSNNTGWAKAQLVQSATTTQLADATDVVNTIAKVEGNLVFNATTNKPVWAAGSNATDVWVDATGSTAHSPS